MKRNYCENKCKELWLKNRSAIARAAWVSPAAVTYWAKHNHFPKWAMSSIKTGKAPVRERTILVKKKSSVRPGIFVAIIFMGIGMGLSFILFK